MSTTLRRIARMHDDAFSFAIAMMPRLTKCRGASNARELIALWYRVCGPEKIS